MEQIQIIDSKNHVGETVTIGAWVANKRSSGKIAFLQLRDGTAFFQGEAVPSLNCKNAIFPIDRLFATLAAIVSVSPTWFFETMI